MEEKHKFYPFRDVDDEKSDVDFDDIAEDLGLTRTQKLLLWRLLGDLEIVFWFTDENKDRPTLEVCAFWGNHLSSTDLIDKLAAYFQSRNEIGDEEEIAVLNRLKTIIDAAISERRQSAPPQELPS